MRRTRQALTRARKQSSSAATAARASGGGRESLPPRRAEPDPLAPVQKRLAARELFGSPERKFARLDLAGHLARRASQERTLR
jgi:hypothetical protein